ncbi:phage shock protein PspA [Aestuariibacter halophilus]|uniref:Phage shock protein PspA n=1 Tax=Fluctibacter halophilus TaxID=226011 RepID=A0ABS8GCE0_9ALTE|nr:phage shock protein PspA [Aestuariibacter halophilus]MCC2618235.1 phage shock protein PspA [Aestuariibacter halophilus]
MGMFSRMTDIIQANINAMLDKAEDPHKVIRLMVQEMEETLVEVRSVAARGLADKKELTRKLNKQQQLSDDWQAKAELAMQKGREDLARAALVERQQCQANVQTLNDELSTVEEGLTKLQDDSARLNEKLAEAKAKQKSLQVRKESATVRLKAKSKLNVEKIDDAIARFEHYERRIDDLEAQADAYDLVSSGSTLKDEFAALEANDAVEQELEALRKKVA